MAMIVQALEEKGADLSEIKFEVFDRGTLRNIAHGMLRPKLALSFMSRRRIVKQLAALPVLDQERVETDAELEVLEVAESGERDVRMVRPSQMTDTQAGQVFGAGRILESDCQTYRPPANNGNRCTSPVFVDKKHKLLIVSGNNVKFRRKELLEYAQQLL